MEVKKSRYETKLEKLTCFKILIVFLCEFTFEFSFGVLFFIYTKDEKFYGKGDCDQLLFWSGNLWKLYLIEFSFAFLLFCIGISSLLCYNQFLTKVYIGFNNSFKTLIVIFSVVILPAMTVIYNYNEECGELRTLTFYWLIFHCTLLGFTLIACIIICFVTCYIVRTNKKYRENRLTLL